MTIASALFRAAPLAAWLALAGCTAAPPAPPAPEPSLYERAGGRAAIVAVVDDAFATAEADPRINARFGNAAIAPLKRKLVDLLCMRMGGPCVYTGLNMSAAHEGMHIRGEEFDAMIEDIAKSLDKFKAPPREREEVLAILRQMKGAIIEH